MTEYNKKTDAEMLNLISYAEELLTVLRELYDTEEEISSLTGDRKKQEDDGESLTPGEQKELAYAAAAEERLRLADKALEGLKMLDRAVSGNACSDPACGTCALQYLTVVKGAALCVYRATDGMHNRSAARNMNSRAKKDADQADKTAAVIYDRVLRGITGL